MDIPERGTTRFIRGWGGPRTQKKAGKFRKWVSKGVVAGAHKVIPHRGYSSPAENRGIHLRAERMSGRFVDLPGRYINSHQRRIILRGGLGEVFFRNCMYVASYIQ